MTEKSGMVDFLPSVIPVFPLSGVILLPGTSLPLHIFEPRYLKMIRDAIAGNRLIGMVQPRIDTEVSGPPPLYRIGGVGSIGEDVKETEDGRFLIRLKGLSRFEVAEELSVTTPYRQVRASWTPFQEDPWGGEQRGAEDRDALMAALKAYLAIKGLDADFGAIGEAPDSVLVNTLSMIVPFSPAEKQALLEAQDVPQRCDLLKNLLTMAARTTMRSTGPSSSH